MENNATENLISVKKEKLEIFKDILLEYNKKYNLTAISDEKSIKNKHFYDSIAPEKLFPFGAEVIEIGSGAGFPSIPLKIVREDLKFTLVESVGKKCNFLRTAVETLGLKCVKVENGRAEELAKKVLLREKFDVATARAVAKLNTLCEYCLPFVKVGGIFISYKSSVEEEIEESKNAVKILGGAIEKIYDYTLPEDGAKRMAVVIRKIKNTADKYPRGRGLERKKPL